MIMAQDRSFVQPRSTTWDGGYSLYMQRRPITACDSIAAARGWLAAEYGEAACLAHECGIECPAVPPSAYGDADILGIIAQAEELAESYYWQERNRGH